MVQRHLLTLPAEIRLQILDHVFDRPALDTGFVHCAKPRGLILNESYRAHDRLSPLLVCRQLYHDAQPIALSRTNFVVASLFTKVADRLSQLPIKQVRSLRHVTFIADARHFRQLVHWGEHPFAVPELSLDTLTIVLHRASHWHYLFDFTSDITMLLRRLRGVQRIVFVRNDAKVKGSFKTWYNRLVGLMMKIDHRERYLGDSAKLESVWWTWALDEEHNTITLIATPPKPVMEEQAYMERMAPLLEQLTRSIESEEWNADPRARLMYY